MSGRYTGVLNTGFREPREDILTDEQKGEAADHVYITSIARLFLLRL